MVISTQFVLPQLHAQSIASPFNTAVQAQLSRITEALANLHSIILRKCSSL